MKVLNNEYHKKVIFNLFTVLRRKGKIDHPDQMINTVLCLFPEYKTNESSLMEDIKHLVMI